MRPYQDRATGQSRTDLAEKFAAAGAPFGLIVRRTASVARYSCRFFMFIVPMGMRRIGCIWFSEFPEKNNPFSPLFCFSCSTLLEK